MSKPAKYEESRLAREVLTEMENEGVLNKETRKHGLKYWDRIFTEKRKVGVSCKVFRRMSNSQAVEFIRRLRDRVNVSNIEIVGNNGQGSSIRFSF